MLSLLLGSLGVRRSGDQDFRKGSSGQFGHVLARCHRAPVCHGLHPGAAAPSLLQGGAARGWLQIEYRIYMCSASVSMERFPFLSLRCVYIDTILNYFSSKM